MKTLNKKLIAVAVVALATLAAPAAYAGDKDKPATTGNSGGNGNKPVPVAPTPVVVAPAPVVAAPAPAPTSVSSLSTVINDPSALDGDFNFVNFQNKSVTFTYSGATPTRIAAGEDFANQSYDNVGSTLKTVFKTGNFIGNAGQVDSVGGAKTASFTSAIAFNYLAIHLGGTEVFFDFGSTGVAAGKTLNFSTTGQGFSNFRAFSTLAAVTPPPTTPPGTSTVPVPGAVWLFGSGLAGLIGMRRRKAAASGLAA